jgi:hypothetical protein
MDAEELEIEQRAELLEILAALVQHVDAQALQRAARLTAGLSVWENYEPHLSTALLEFLVWALTHGMCDALKIIAEEEELT